ncbi:MAG: glycosyltransferase family 39 protein [Chloroflexi bacterium]|nr:glycosyltransferase family 39 protein [Chloroflexota bacterium]
MMSQSRIIRRINRETLSKNASKLMLVYVIVFVIAGFFTMRFYGFTWDEAVGDVFFGERYFHFWTTFNPAYLDFERTDLITQQRPFNVFSSSYKDKPNEFLPVGNTVSGMMEEIFSYRLGWLDPIDGFHFGKVVLAALLLWVLYHFVAPRLGKLTAAFAVLILSTYPRFWGDMHFNPLDIPASIFFAFTIFAFYIWTENPSWRQAAITGVLFGWALGSKATSHFIPVVLLLGTFPWQLLPRIWIPAIAHVRKYIGHYTLMILLGPIVFFVSWPYLWGDPNRLLVYYDFIFTEGYTRGTQSWNWDPLVQALTTMPEIDLMLLLIGIMVAIYQLFLSFRAQREISPQTEISRRSAPRNDRLLQLLLVWFAIPILRASLPGAANFDGIRHFQEFVPPACLLMAYGATSLINLAMQFTQRRWIVTSGLALLIVANIAIIEAKYFPYDYLYYNSLVGGLKGMQQRDVDSTDYWGGSYRQGIQWLNYNVEGGTQVHVAIAPWIVKLASPIWLRSDINIIEEPVVKMKIDQGYPVYAMFITRPGWYNNVANYAVQNLKPIHQIDVDGAMVLVIYRLTDVKDIPN